MIVWVIMKLGGQLHYVTLKLCSQYGNDWSEWKWFLYRDVEKTNRNNQFNLEH